MKVKIFGKSIPLLAIVAIAMSAGLVSAAVVSYLSDTITQPVEVKSPIELSGAITCDAITGYVSGSPETFTVEANLDDANLWNNVKAVITKTDDLDISVVEFKVEILDTNTSGWVYEAGIYISTDIDRVDFVVRNFDFTLPDLNVPEPGGWYYREGPWTSTFDGKPYVPLEGSETGITATGEITDKTFTISIPIDLLGGEGATYYYAIEFSTNLHGTYPDAFGPELGPDVETDASNFAVATVGEPVRESTTVSFDGAMDLTLHGGDEFYMDFEATNLANKPIDALLALVIECPPESTWTSEVTEIDEIDPLEMFRGTSGTYAVLVFDGLDAIGPNATRELPIRMLLSEIIKPETYVFRAVVVWSKILELPSEEIVPAILGAARIP